MTHETRLSRYPRGSSIPWNRPTYGYTVSCSCGWAQRVNGTKREAERVEKAHLREAAPVPHV